MTSIFLQLLCFACILPSNNALRFNAVTKHAKHDLSQHHPPVRHSFVLQAKRRTTLSKGRGATGIEGETKVDATVPVEKPPTFTEPIVQSPPPPIMLAASDDLSSSTSAVKGRQLSQRIQDDISDFERMGSLREKKVEEPENGVAKALKNVFAAVFIADFFVVIVFLIWFLAAAAMQKTNPFLLEKFQVQGYVILSSSKTHGFIEFLTSSLKLCVIMTHIKSHGIATAHH